jgi:hypothetical protein
LFIQASGFCAASGGGQAGDSIAFSPPDAGAGNHNQLDIRTGKKTMQSEEIDCKLCSLQQ